MCPAIALNLPEDELRRLYERKKLSVGEVANRLGCSEFAIRGHLAKAGIPTRSKSEAQRLRWARDKYWMMLERRLAKERR